MSSILNSTTTTEGLNKSLITNRIKRNIKARTKLVKLSIKDFISNVQNKSQNSNISFTKNYSITERTGEMEVIKLRNWDRDNLIQISNESERLYSSLKLKYSKSKSKPKLIKLDSFQKILENSNDELRKIIKNKTKASHNNIIQNFIKKDKEEQTILLLNNIAKTKNKFNFFTIENNQQRSFESNFGFDSNSFNLLNDKKINSQIYRKIIKEKKNQENYERRNLMNISIQYMNKKNERIESETELSKIFTEINNLTSKFNVQKNSIKVEILNVQQSLENIQKEGKSTKEELLYVSRQKTIEINTLNQKLRNYHRKYLLDLKKQEEIKLKKEKEINLLKEEENYLKIIKLGILSSQKEYYLDILKKGYDVRDNGLVWCIKNLLELQSDLEYSHFPKFLNHQQCDYLIEQANIALEISQLKIIVKVLKNKNEKSNVEKKFAFFNQMYLNAKKNKNLRKKNRIQEEIEMLRKQNNLLTKTDIHLNKVFNNLFTNHKDAFKLQNDKKMEELKIENITNDLKETLLEQGGNLNPKKENIDSVFNLIEQDSETKDFLENIVILRFRLDYLEKLQEDLKEQQIKLFKNTIENHKKIHKILTAETSLQNDLVFSALFGNKVLS
jgi:hypothetical protein